MQFNEWAGWSYAFCLKEQKRYEEALAVCRKLYPRFKQSEFISTLYAQCIFYTQIKVKPQPSISIQKKAVKGMIRLSPPHREYSLSGVAILKLCKNLRKEKPVPWQEIEFWLDHMEPDLLSRDTYRTKLPNGKILEYASQQENWYSEMIRVKAGLKEHEQLLELLDEAHKKNIRWHYQNDVWMKRKRAFAYHELGRSREAESLLRQILKQKRDWFLYADLGEVLTEKKEKLKYFCRAALESGKLEMKINLFNRIGDLLNKDQEENKAYLGHLLLQARIRLENDWTIPAELESGLKKENIEIGDVNSANEAYQKLKPFWQEKSGMAEQMHKGRIKYLHKNGKSGMIKGDDDNEYFFGMSQIKTKGIEVEPGLSVQFEIKDGYDKKKQRPSKMAINVQLIKN